VSRISVVNKLFRLPPSEERTVPGWANIGRRSKEAFFPEDIQYVYYLASRAGFLTTLVFGLLYAVSSFSRISFNLWFFRIAVPETDFVLYFRDNFSMQLAPIEYATALFYAIILIVNVRSFDNLFAAAKRRSIGDQKYAVNSVFCFLICMLVMLHETSITSVLLDYMGNSRYHSALNSHFFMIVQILLFAIANAYGVFVLALSGSGLFYYFPKYFRTKRSKNKIG
jgi:hypothetical protein